MRQLNRKSICTRKPSNMSKSPNYIGARKSAIRAGLRKKTKCKCQLDGHSLFLSTAGTMPFSLNGMRGFYNGLMEWVEL